MGNRTCTIEGCERPLSSRGWCSTHYMRWRTHGDPHVTLLIRGDNERRFWSYVDKTDGCWNWTGAIPGTGYGGFDLGGKTVPAHRYSYELNVGPIPDGMVIDHLCRNTICVRPDHLEPVTQRENVLRGTGPTAVNARKTHCIWGHEFTPENTYEQTTGGRGCKTCKRLEYQRNRDHINARRRERRRRKRQAT